MKPLLLLISLIAFVNQPVRSGQIVNSPVAVKGAVGPRFRTWNGFQACFADPASCFRPGFTGSAPASGAFAK